MDLKNNLNFWKKWIESYPTGQFICNFKIEVQSRVTIVNLKIENKSKNKSIYFEAPTEKINHVIEHWILTNIHRVVEKLI